jgi:serine/threonine protein kinase
MSSSIVLKENSTFGEFKLIKQLGRGGMAEVYLARADGVGGFQRNLALKVIHPQLSHDQEFVQMLIDEAKLSAQLNHPNIVHIHNLGQIQGVYYIAMEFIDGCDVYQALVKSEGRDEVFPVEVAAWITHEACAGLYYAHTRRGSDGQPLNIIHRDISPQNIQLSREGEVKIVDFGIAKAEQRTSHTQQGVIKGKYSYMSPEQAWGDDIDHRSDIFSLGICLYEMLAGEVLYDAEDGLGLLEQVRLAQIPSLRAIRPEISPEIEQIVYRSLAAEPLQRFNTAEDMRIALAGYLFRSGVTSGRQHLTHFLMDSLIHLSQMTQVRQLKMME